VRIPSLRDRLCFAASLRAAWNAMLKGDAGDRLWTTTAMGSRSRSRAQRKRAFFP
jgi:hypothetical protein